MKGDEEERSEEAPEEADLEEWLEKREYERVRAWLEDTTALNAARSLSRSRADIAGAAFRLAGRERQLEVFELLEADDQKRILEGLGDETAIRLVREMDVDDQARIIGEMPAKVAARFLAGMRTKDLSAAAILLGYPEGTAGRMMSPEYVALKADMTAAEALERIRMRALDAETIYTLPVLDSGRRIAGIIGLRRLIIAPDQQKISDLLFEDDIYSISAYSSAEEASMLLRDTGLLALPVVDGEQRMIGVVTVDDAMDVLKEAEKEDAALHGGSRPLRGAYMSSGVTQLARSRAVWLLMLIVAAALTVNVLQHFEETLTRLITLALFIPLLIDTGGNAGAQASTVVTRALALGEIREGDLLRVLGREASTGALLGTMLAAVALGPVWILFGAEIAAVVSLTLLAVCTWASAVGSALPLLAQRTGGDPAVVSAPVVTTLVDGTGLVIYFLIARAMLGV